MNRVKQLLWKFKTYLSSPVVAWAARKSGFIRRQRILDAESFVMTLVTACMAQPEVTYTSLAQTGALLGAPLSPQAWAQRFTREAAAFLYEVLQGVVALRIAEAFPRLHTLLQRFRAIYIRDSTQISLPQALSPLWPGCGGRRGPTASLKVHVRFEYLSGLLEGPALDPGRAHDRHTPYRWDQEPPESLCLHDLAYFNLDEVAHRLERGQHVLIRYKQGTHLYTSPTAPTPFDLIGWLRSLSGPYGQRVVWVGKRHRLRMRVVAFRLPPEQAARRRQRLKEWGRKHQRPVSKASRFLAGWVIFLVSLDEEDLSVEEIAVLARLRWQIEILFRLWKQHGRIHRWRSQNPWRILCEVYAKLIGVVLMHWLFLLCWPYRLDFSILKGGQAVTKIALALMGALLRQKWTEVHRLLKSLFGCFAKTCRIHRRRKLPATFQLIEEPALAIPNNFDILNA